MDSFVAALKAGDAQRAMGLAQAALSRDPKDPEWLSGRSTLFLMLGDYGRAIKDLDVLIQVVPGQAEFHNNRGSALRELGRSDEALADFDQALKLKPDHAKSYFNRGQCLRDLYRGPEALPDLARAIELESDYHKAYNARGEVLLEQGEYAAAHQALAAAVRLFPGASQYQFNLGAALLGLAREREALDCLLQGFTGEGGFQAGPAALLLLWTMARLGRHEAAREGLSDLGALLFQGPWIPMLEGALTLAEGQLEQACAHMAAALQQRPGLVAARVELARALIAKGDTEAAQSHLSAVLKAFPRDLRASALAARILRVTGRKADAEALLANCQGQDCPLLDLERWQTAGDEAARIRVQERFPDLPEEALFRSLRVAPVVQALGPEIVPAFPVSAPRDSSLEAAIASYSVDAVEAALAAGASPTEGDMPALYMALSLDHPEIVERLLKAMPGPIPDWGGFTPMGFVVTAWTSPSELSRPDAFYSTERRKSQLLQLLARAAVDPNHTHSSPLGEVGPLDEAVISGSFGLESRLLRLGAESTASTRMVAASVLARLVALAQGGDGPVAPAAARAAAGSKSEGAGSQAAAGSKAGGAGAQTGGALESGRGPHPTQPASGGPAAWVRATLVLLALVVTWATFSLLPAVSEAQLVDLMEQAETAMRNKDYPTVLHTAGRVHHHGVRGHEREFVRSIELLFEVNRRQGDLDRCRKLLEELKQLDPASAEKMEGRLNS